MAGTMKFMSPQMLSSVISSKVDEGFGVGYDGFKADSFALGGKFMSWNRNRPQNDADRAWQIVLLRMSTNQIHTAFFVTVATEIVQ